jgi:2,3-bisphosphoglycerate-independent phosphoglycerate mutase
MNKNAKAVLIILDGFGIGKDSPYNAIANSNMPFYKELITKYPHSQLLTHGEAVGLPNGVMGNSEVGHMTMGAGRNFLRTHR